ncbi:hypothetical protein [Ahrensia marina]|uniref:Uncharacterized protein n=1 Tax=Ahrensia marina TaxID=1514904 RepID=A0A0M9GPN4_9HYPH|nr:hypothetical protein [Ahrensia marina]KPB02426.1 hypothetical protein SU32_04070 [Ahrensia marina]
MKSNVMKFAAVFLSVAAINAPIMTSPAAAADMVYLETQSGDCSDTKVLNTIASRFQIQAREVHHNPDLQISDLNNTYETRFEPEGKSPFARRYCKGQAYMSDGQSRSVWYLLEYGAGFAGIGKNVEFCISGLDRWNVYGAQCNVLR